MDNRAYLAYSRSPHVDVDRTDWQQSFTGFQSLPRFGACNFPEMSKNVTYKRFDQSW